MQLLKFAQVEKPFDVCILYGTARKSVSMKMKQAEIKGDGNAPLRRSFYNGETMKRRTVNVTTREKHRTITLRTFERSS